jgi:transcriptional regulator with XRE-family HTH domain
MKLLSERLAYIYKERPDLEGERGQIGLVRASGASRAVVNQWLNDKIKSIDIMYALRIEQELGYSHIWLMTGLGEPHAKPEARVSLVMQPKPEPPRLTLATPEELDLLDEFRRSTDRGRANIIDAAKLAPKRPIAELASNKA